MTRKAARKRERLERKMERKARRAKAQADLATAKLQAERNAADEEHEQEMETIMSANTSLALQKLAPRKKKKLEFPKVGALVLDDGPSADVVERTKRMEHKEKELENKRQFADGYTYMKQMIHVYQEKVEQMHHDMTRQSKDIKRPNHTPETNWKWQAP